MLFDETIFFEFVFRFNIFVSPSCHKLILYSEFEYSIKKTCLHVSHEKRCAHQSRCQFILRLLSISHVLFHAEFLNASPHVVV
jgi:hypothetical protein